jgi:hypothetical protein
LGNINSIRGSGWHITIKAGNIYNGKIEVVSPVIESGKKFTTDVKFEVSVAKWNRGICCFFYLKSFSDILIEYSKQSLNYLLTEQHQCTWKSDCKWLLKTFGSIHSMREVCPVHDTGARQEYLARMETEIKRSHKWENRNTHWNQSTSVLECKCSGRYVFLFFSIALSMVLIWCGSCLSFWNKLKWMSMVCSRHNMA